MEKLLETYMTPDSSGNAVFRPSFHMLNRGTVTVADISIAGSRKKTADMMLKKNNEKGYMIENAKEGEPHVHLDL